ncbi:hypothetical protein BRADI_3g37885v3 [Brachypodium distachyon]|uniref:Uncharacterized protein n=1 Tax=Brachypodium distachyon TaxID=15368 RepID=A0A2K2D1W8_BRADI|nr:hypothetical protein BRADI_3g37885v3 [Brachypodium distachyon]
MSDPGFDLLVGFWFSGDICMSVRGGAAFIPLRPTTGQPHNVNVTTQYTSSRRAGRPKLPVLQYDGEESSPGNVNY